MNKEKIYNDIKGFTGALLIVVGVMILAGDEAVPGRSALAFWLLKLWCVPFFYLGGTLLNKTIDREQL